MNIDPHDKIAGIPILVVRELMRWAKANPWDEWGLDLVRNRLELSTQQSLTLVEGLILAGYVEPVKKSNGHAYWRLTLNGSSLATAKASKPLKRETAERILAEFMDRVRQVADSPEFLYKVQQVVLFGSYLTSKQRLGDIDIAIKLMPKIKDREEMRRLANEKVDEAWLKGRKFRSFYDEMSWPVREVRLYLKNRSTAISLHTVDDPILDQARRSNH